MEGKTMKSILGAFLLGILLTLAPATAWSQTLPLAYKSSMGTTTDISGGLYSPSVGYWLPNGGGWVYLCPPSVAYAQGGDPPRRTGGDGIRTASDAQTLSTGAQTQTTYAHADGRG